MPALTLRNTGLGLFGLLAFASVTAAIVLSLGQSDAKVAPAAASLDTSDVTPIHAGVPELIGAAEPLFIGDEPVTLPIEIDVIELPDGSVSITNPDSGSGQPGYPGIAVGEPHPDVPEGEWAVQGWYDDATGKSAEPVLIGPVTVNVSELPPAPPGDPDIVFAAPNPIFDEQVVH